MLLLLHLVQLLMDASLEQNAPRLPGIEMENHRTNWSIPLPCLIAKGNLWISMEIFHFVMAPK